MSDRQARRIEDHHRSCLTIGPARSPPRRVQPGLWELVPVAVDQQLQLRGPGHCQDEASMLPTGGFRSRPDRATTGPRIGGSTGQSSPFAWWELRRWIGGRSPGTALVVSLWAAACTATSAPLQPIRTGPGRQGTSSARIAQLFCDARFSRRDRVHRQRSPARLRADSNLTSTPQTSVAATVPVAAERCEGTQERAWGVVPEMRPWGFQTWGGPVGSPPTVRPSTVTRSVRTSGQQGSQHTPSRPHTGRGQERQPEASVWEALSARCVTASSTSQAIGAGPSLRVR